MSNSNLSGGLKHGIHKAVMKVREAMTPVPTVSQFKQQRTLTPAEFVLAGEYLVRQFPSWEWYGGVQSKRKNYLGGPEKQCLVIRKVPANPVTQISSVNLDEVQEDEDGEWVCPGVVTNETREVPDMEIPDISTEDLEIPDDDPSALPAEPQNRRLYDLYITYDLVYKVPRFWLVGYDANLTPLSSQEIGADVSKEHAGLTLTWDPHPHEDFHAVSIHPCRHAQVMKELLDTMEVGGNTVAVDHYLLVFLKFITALIPTIEYDYTMGV